MNLLNPAEIIDYYSQTGKAKAEKPALKLLLLAVLAGLLIALGAATASTASHSIGDVSTVRMVSGLLFPFGLAIVILLGAELFTGNTMIAISVLNRQAKLSGLLRNWLLVYIGNFAGAMLLAAGTAWFGQMDYSAGGLAVYSIKLAAGKTALPFFSALVLGIFCNVLVCAGVLCSYSAKDTSGRILGAYIPVALFVICGFEHCVANMFYIPAGLFAMQVPAYAQAAQQAGIDVTSLNWSNFLLGNLLPVTLGNIAGGVGLSLILWLGHRGRHKTMFTAE